MIDIDQIDRKYPMPPYVFEKLPFAQRFRARWLDLEEAIKVSLPPTRRHCAQYLQQQHIMRYIAQSQAKPENPKKGQRWLDANTQEVKEFDGENWKVVRRA